MFPVHGIKTKRRFINVAFNIWGWRTDAVTLRAVPSVGSVIRFSKTVRIAPRLYD
jgi:hypothetical protein